jgi:hypothetical protein
MVPFAARTDNVSGATSTFQRALRSTGTKDAPDHTPQVQLFERRGLAILENGFIHLEFDPQRAAITTLTADFFGRGQYQNNLLGREGIHLDILDVNKQTRSATVAAGARTEKQITPGGITLHLPMIELDSGSTARSHWIITLAPGARCFGLVVRTHIHNQQATGLVRLRLGCNQWFFNAIYERGNVQRMEGLAQTFCSQDKLNVFYTMDCQNGSIAIVPQGKQSVIESHLVSSHESIWGASECGLDQVLCGTSSVFDQWIPTPHIQSRTVNSRAGNMSEVSLCIYASDKAFPVHTIAPDTTMEFDDLAAYYTAAYGSSAGVMGSYAIPGSAYPNLATPQRPYGNGNSFFDPDAWETVTMLSFSGDPLLARQAREVLERSGGAMSSNGQIPHNFNGKKPSFIAISGATQSGPNLFWSLACLDYAMGTGDEAWLAGRYELIKKAVDWLLHGYDPARRLIKFTGSLFIDVLIRYGYTLDTNMAMVHLLDRLAPVAQFCGDGDGAARFRKLKAAIAMGIRTELWDGKDHFITQRNVNGTTRDFVDYDGNYGALAFGIVEDAQWRANMFYRLDGGDHTHPGGRGTWVSEKYYGAADCYRGNTGDSATAMGRIWWLDMKARHQYPTHSNREMFNRTYQNIRGDLLANTWLTERYGVRGQRIRTPYYHEYPEIVSTVMRTIRYGIDVQIDRVTIRPIEPIEFDFHAGALQVSYRPRRIFIHVPGRRNLIYQIHHLTPHATYRLSNSSSITSDANGTLEFRGSAGLPYHINE